jgi:predicted  nucleic acid-binding Zn-ribbon protein
MIYTEQEVKQREDALKSELIKTNHKCANQNKELKQLKEEKEKYERSFSEIQVAREAEKKEIAKLIEENKNLTSEKETIQLKWNTQIAEYDEVLF